MTLYDWIGIADTQTEQGDIFKDEEKKDFFEQRSIFLSAFTFHESYLHPTIWVVSHNSGPFFWSEEIQIEEWKQGKIKGKLSKKRKKREAKLSSQGHHLKKQNKK